MRVLTTRDAARVLTAAGPQTPLVSLAAALGFGAPLLLDRRELISLGVDDPPARAWLAPGSGSLRALVLDWHAGAPLRERVASVGRRLPRNAPGRHWLIIARRCASREVVVAAPAPDGKGPLQALLVEVRHVRESDAETFATLAAADGVDLLVHLRWRETLGRDALTRRFYRDLEHAVGLLADTASGRADARERRTIALLTTSRLLFLAFLEAKGWLDRDRAFLRHQMERLSGGSGLQRRMLEPLFFGTLNTPVAHRSRAALAFGRVPFLNGGLFARSGVETRCRALRFTDEAIGAVIGDLLARYRVTARETSETFSDAAVDPEMLGQAFESLMASDTRRAQGAFYTPHPLIVRVTRAALDAANAAGGAVTALGPGSTLRIVDPACGSGAFLVFALEELAAQRLAQGDERPVSVVRREILTQSIFGVDLDPTAVWLCQLRLWLSVVVEDDRDDPMRLAPLPNLDRNVREGDALAGFGFGDAQLPGDPRIEAVRLRYVRASGARKRTLARALDVAERARAVVAAEQRISRLTSERRELLLVVRSPDLFRSRRGADAAMRGALADLRTAIRGARTELRRIRDRGALPFSFATHFPEVAAAGGFDLVLGNPPWVRPHAIALETREALRARFESFRRAAWTVGAESAGAGRGFASQADLAAIFTERAVQLAAHNGVIALLLPSKLWSALAGGGVRGLLSRRTTLLALDDWTGGTAGFDAAVYPSALLARRTRDVGSDVARAESCSAVRDLQITVHHSDGAHSWSIAAAALPLDESPGAPWLLLPPDVRAAFDALVRAGIPLADSPLGRPILGVKSGCNEAFVVEPAGFASASGEVPVRSGEARGTVDEALLRPLLRGEHLRPWRIAEAFRGDAIVWTHDALGAAVAELPPATRRWLSHWRRQLEARSDARGARWWTLFRTESARSDRPRVVWGDIGLAPRASVLVVGDHTVPLNTCYVVRTRTEDDAHALAALLNSTVAGAWLGIVAEPARGGYRRYLGWTCARLPVPRDWERARALLAPLGRAGAAGDPPETQQLARMVAEAYGVPLERLAPLLEWGTH